MSDQDWADGPTNGRADSEPSANWGHADDTRHATPSRGGGRRDRSASPMRGIERERGRNVPGIANPGSNLHVSGLSGRCNDDDLRELFGKHGPIIKCQVILDPHTRESRGFAFVHFEQAVDAEAAIDALNGTDFMGKMLSVQKARRGRARTPTPGQYHGPPKDNFPPPRYNDDRWGGGGYGGPPGRDPYFDRGYPRRDDYNPRGRSDDYPPPRDSGRRRY